MRKLTTEDAVDQINCCCKVPVGKGQQEEDSELGENIMKD